MYFEDREEAGNLLADELMDYRYENTIVMGLSPGGVVVGDVIAKRLHTVVTMLLLQDIKLPGLFQTQIGILNQSGEYTRSEMIPAMVLEDMEQEFHNHIEFQKMQKMHDINQLLGDYGVVDRKFLSGTNLIIVSDAFKNGSSITAAMEFIKPIPLSRIIIASPVASVTAIDRMHVVADEIKCLSVRDNFFDTNHYYEQNDIPDNGGIQELMRNTVHGWK